MVSSVPASAAKADTFLASDFLGWGATGALRAGLGASRLAPHVLPMVLRDHLSLPPSPRAERADSSDFSPLSAPPIDDFWTERVSELRLAA